MRRLLHPVFAISLACCAAAADVPAAAAPAMDVIRDFHATGDCVTDDTAAFQAAAKAGGAVTIPRPRGGCYVVTREIRVTAPANWRGAGAAVSVIRPRFDSASTPILFAIETSNFTAEDIGIDATGLTYTPAKTNHYAIMISSNNAPASNIVLRGIEVTNWKFSDGRTALNNHLVSHAVYAQNVHGMTIEHCVFTGISGAAVIFNNSSNVRIAGNRFASVQWYNVNAHYGDSDVEIAGNSFDNTKLPSGVFYGGAVEAMSQTRKGGGDAPDSNIWVHDNDIQGYYSYGAAMRYESVHGLVSEHNTIHNWQQGSWTISPNDTSAIVVITRGTGPSDQNGPSQNVTIHDEQIYAPSQSGQNRAIYFANNWQTGRNPVTNVVVEDNGIYSRDAVYGFANAIIFHGSPSGAAGGGFEGVRITGNYGTTVTTAHSPVPGAIGFVSGNPNGAVHNVVISGNTFSDIGRPDRASYRIGIYLGDYTDRVRFGVNRIGGYFYGLVATRKVGPNLFALRHQVMTNIGGADYIVNGKN